MGRMKLARAAAQQLKGVIIEYDALCSTKIGQSVSNQLAQGNNPSFKALFNQEQEKASDKVASFLPTSIKNMFVNDVRSLLKDLNQDSTGKPWIVKDRLQSTLQNLPAHVLDRMMGDGSQKTKSEEELYLEQQLAAATKEKAHAEEQKISASTQREMNKILQRNPQGNSAIREKYMDKLTKLKARTKDSKEAGLLQQGRERSTVKGLSTWIVNKGANELLSYANLRGLVKAVIPPASSNQNQEFDEFMKEMKDQFDVFVSIEEMNLLPDKKVVESICKELQLTPIEVMVVAKNNPLIRGASNAGANCCQFLASEVQIPNHSAQYHLTDLQEFQYIVEEFNGISYRGRTPV